MKNYLKTAGYTLLSFWLTLMTAVYAIAQEQQPVEVTTRTTTTRSEQWYTMPWVWIAGGAVFILLLVALMRGAGSHSSSHSD